MLVLLTTVLLAAPAPSPPPTPAEPVENECERFNREEEARRAHHTGPCPYCPCACGPRGIVCAPCVACREDKRDRMATPVAASPRVRHRVSGRVVAVSQICGGGAAITPELEAQLPPPRPLAGKELLVVGGETISTVPATARITTGPSGQFEIRLPPGTWCIFDAGRKLEKSAKRPNTTSSASPSSPYLDAACLAQERRRCDAILQVADADQRDVQISFFDGCPQVYNQPCYRGPPPP